MIITTTKRVPFPFRKESRIFIESKRILDSSKPPRDWVTSPRVSKTAVGAPPLLYYPETAELAVHLMKHEIHACGIIFEDEPVVSPFPFGPVWINTADKIYSWGVGSAKELYGGKDYQGAFGHLCQDGCKFHSGISENKYPSLEGVIIKKIWIPYLTQTLNAFVKQNEPWHTGTGVYT
jgi:hypothetical protein